MTLQRISLFVVAAGRLLAAGISASPRFQAAQALGRQPELGWHSTNTYFWIDLERGIAGVVMMQLLPFADTKALAIYDAFELDVYQLADASRKPDASR